MRDCQRGAGRAHRGGGARGRAARQTGRPAKTPELYARDSRRPSAALNLYTYVVIAGAILSWLIAFNVINFHNDFVRSIGTPEAVTEPLLRPIRSFLPTMGGLDISPIILLLLIFWSRIIVCYVYPNVF